MVRGIGVADPGAVPGASTILRGLADPAYGGEPGSTRVVKALLSPGMIPPLSGQILSANDNKVALAAGFDRAYGSAGCVPWLIRGPRKYLIKLQLLNRSSPWLLNKTVAACLGA